MNDDAIKWPSAVVACFLISLVGAVSVTSIIRYGVDDALKVWAALGSIVGVITGAVVTYFFSRQAVKKATESANNAQQTATNAQRIAAQQTERADGAQRALAALAGSVDPQQLEHVKQRAPALRTFLEP
jgi:type IV secretory pathway VirB6-like protein